MYKIIIKIKNLTLNDLKNINDFLKSKAFTLKHVIKIEKLKKPQIIDLKKQLNIRNQTQNVINISTHENEITDTFLKINNTQHYDILEKNLNNNESVIYSKKKTLKDTTLTNLLINSKNQIIYWQHFNNTMQDLRFIYFDEKNLKNIFLNNNCIDYKPNNEKSLDINFNYNIDYDLYNSSNIVINNEDKLYIYNKFKYLKYSSFINFFIENQINVPTSFKKIQSLKRKSSKLPLLKLVNVLMKHGKKEQYGKYLFNTLAVFFSNPEYNIFLNCKKKTNSELSALYDIRFFKNLNLIDLHNYFYLNNVLFFYLNDLNWTLGEKKHKETKDDIKFFTNYANEITKDEKNAANDFSLDKFIVNKLIQISPVFTYFILNVDKKVRKFSRGKSGRYKLIWKYVINYKRINVVLKLVKQLIKFMNGQKFKNRIFSAFFNIFSDINTNSLLKIKHFSYNYVYKNYKWTLMQTLKDSK